MNPTHIKIKPFLSQAEIEYYLKLSEDPEGYINHQSTKSDRITNLHFKPVDFRGMKKTDKNKAMLLLINSYDIEGWHIDGPRNTVIIQPLTTNYAPCSCSDGDVNGPIILDVKQKHAVFNNETRRVAFQINCGFDFTTNLDDYKHIPIHLETRDYDMAS